MREATLANARAAKAVKRVASPAPNASPGGGSSRVASPRTPNAAAASPGANLTLCVTPRQQSSRQTAADGGDGMADETSSKKRELGLEEQIARLEADLKRLKKNTRAREASRDATIVQLREMIAEGAGGERAVDENGNFLVARWVRTGLRTDASERRRVLQRASAKEVQRTSVRSSSGSRRGRSSCTTST